MGEGLVRLNAPYDAWGMTWQDYYLKPEGENKQWYARTIADQKKWVEEYDIMLDLSTPVLSFTPEELEEKVQIEAQLHTYVDEQLVSFIHGNADVNAEWSAFTKKLNDLGARKLEEIYNAAAKRWAEEMGYKL